MPFLDDIHSESSGTKWIEGRSFNRHVVEKKKTKSSLETDSPKRKAIQNEIVWQAAFLGLPPALLLD